MDWKVLAALAVLGLALVAWLIISILTGVNRYAKRLVEEKPDPRRGFEVKTISGGESPVRQEENEAH